jgi:hypothetical protein
MKTEMTIESEFKKIEDMINDVKFRELAVKFCKKVGITAKEWNENKIGILTMLALKVYNIEK